MVLRLPIVLRRWHRAARPSPAPVGFVMLALRGDLGGDRCGPGGGYVSAHGVRDQRGGLGQGLRVGVRVARDADRVPDPRLSPGLGCGGFRGGGLCLCFGLGGFDPCAPCCAPGTVGGRDIRAGRAALPLLRRDTRPAPAVPTIRPAVSCAERLDREVLADAVVVPRAPFDSARHPQRELVCLVLRCGCVGRPGPSYIAMIRHARGSVRQALSRRFQHRALRPGARGPRLPRCALRQLRRRCPPSSARRGRRARARRGRHARSLCGRSAP